MSLDVVLDALFGCMYPRDPALSKEDTAARVDLCAAATSPSSVEFLAILTVVFRALVTRRLITVFRAVTLADFSADFELANLLSSSRRWDYPAVFTA